MDWIIVLALIIGIPSEPSPWPGPKPPTSGDASMTVDPPDDPAVYAHEVTSFVDPGLGLPLLPSDAAADEKTCTDGCRSRSKGGCVLIDVEATRKDPKTLECKCIWLCMPALKWFQ